MIRNGNSNYIPLSKLPESILVCIKVPSTQFECLRPGAFSCKNADMHIKISIHFAWKYYEKFNMHKIEKL